MTQEQNEICKFMDEVEAKEGKEFDYLMSHHAFTNAMTAAQIVESRRKDGKTKLRHFPVLCVAWHRLEDVHQGQGR